MSSTFVEQQSSLHKGSFTLFEPIDVVGSEEVVPVHPSQYFREESGSLVTLFIMGIALNLHVNSCQREVKRRDNVGDQNELLDSRLHPKNYENRAVSIG